MTHPTPQSAASSNPLPRVVMVGRSNVGKSTLLNRLAEKDAAMVSPVAGTTRDRMAQPISWNGMTFELVDTGGLDIAMDTDIEENVVRQARLALTEADLILMVTEAQVPPTAAEQALAKELRAGDTPVIVAVNKADTLKLRREAPAFASLGLGEPHPVSAINGSGTGDLLDAVAETLASDGKRRPARDLPRALPIAIIGRPNVGKSSLLNAILGQERVITSPIPFTTREPQDTRLAYQGRDLVLVDTVGMRKKARVSRGLERESVARSVKAMMRAEIVILVIDASQPVDRQDATLLRLASDKRKGLIIAANKWDLVTDKHPGSPAELERDIRRSLPFDRWVPVVLVSAKTGQGTQRVLATVLEVDQELDRRITDNALSHFLKKVIAAQPPRLATKKPVVTKQRTKRPYIYGMKQTGTRPPRFELVVGAKQGIHQNWIAFLQRRLREKFGFRGAPIEISVREIQPTVKRPAHSRAKKKR